MIFLHPSYVTVVEEENLEVEHKKATMEAIDKLVDEGYINEDLAWRHVGFYLKYNISTDCPLKRHKIEENESKLFAVMFDMQLRPILNEKRNEAKKKMRECLSLGK